jgi:transcriptional regulator with XRE-family HTH domain
VGKKIKKARTGKKMSYDTLANETGFSIDFLKKVESGKVTPPVGIPAADFPGPRNRLR